MYTCVYSRFYTLTSRFSIVMKRSYRRNRKKDVTPIKEFKINNQITAEEVRFIDEEKGESEVLTLKDALLRAQDSEKDLVEVSPLAKPPVVKLLDYGRYQYQQSKIMRKQKAGQKKTGMKSIRLSARIGKHDIDVRLKQAKKFIDKGAKVKIELVLKGREHKHIDLAKQIVADFIEQLSSDYEEGAIVTEQKIGKVGHTIQAIINKKV